MLIDPEEASTIAAGLMKVRNSEYRSLDLIHDYVEGEIDPQYVPRDAAVEFRQIVRQSRVNVLPLVVDTIAQSLYVDGYRAKQSEENAPAWDQWQANRMDARQTGVHRAALTYGAAYVMVAPGDQGPAWSPFSPRDMTAVYKDAVNNEWPEYALIVRESGGALELVVVAPYERYLFTAKNADSTPEFVGSEVHGVPWTPVVRFVNQYTLDDDPRGEIEPLIPLQGQANSLTFGLGMAAQFAAFRQKWVTGFEVERDSTGRPVEPFKSGVDKLFIGESPDTRFGDFNSADLNGYVDARQSVLRIMATIAQVPPHHLGGATIANLSAEALASLEVQQSRKVAERKSLFGEAWEQTLRLSAYVAGDSEAMADTSAQVIWRDTEARSLASTVDALGKLVTMLGVPPQALWERIPGVTQQDVERWKGEAIVNDPLGQLAALMGPPELQVVTDGDNAAG